MCNALGNAVLENIYVLICTLTCENDIKMCLMQAGEHTLKRRARVTRFGSILLLDGSTKGRSVKPNRPKVRVVFCLFLYPIQGSIAALERSCPAAATVGSEQHLWVHLIEMARDHR